KPATLALEICLRDVRAINLVCTFLQAQHTTNHDPIGNPKPLATQLVDRTRSSRYIDFLRLIKVAREQTHNRIERFLLINAVSYNLQLRAATRSERQDTENRLRICFGVAVETLKTEIALKLARHAYEVRGGACVKTEATRNLDSSFSHFQSAPDLDGGSSKAPAR